MLCMWHLHDDSALVVLSMFDPHMYSYVIKYMHIILGMSALTLLRVYALIYAIILRAHMYSPLLPATTTSK